MFCYKFVTTMPKAFPSKGCLQSFFRGLQARVSGPKVVGGWGQSIPEGPQTAISPENLT